MVEYERHFFGRLCYMGTYDGFGKEIITSDSHIIDQSMSAHRKTQEMREACIPSLQLTHNNEIAYCFDDKNPITNKELALEYQGRKVMCYLETDPVHTLYLDIKKPIEDKIYFLRGFLS